jgi:hypothetical protein
MLPVLFRLAYAATLTSLLIRASYVDEYSLANPVSLPQYVQHDSQQLLDAVNDIFKIQKLSDNIGKFKGMFISRNTQTSERFQTDSKRWKIN